MTLDEIKEWREGRPLDAEIQRRLGTLITMVESLKNKTIGWYLNKQLDDGFKIARLDAEISILEEENAKLKSMIERGIGFEDLVDAH